MLLSRSLLALSGLLLASTVASAAPFTISGNATGALSAATGELTLAGNVLTLQITNTSPYDARITGLGFDLVAGDFSGNNVDGLNNFFGANSAAFKFSDGDLGNVPQFNNIVLDFGWVTKKTFTAGQTNDGIVPSSTLTFSATGNFLGLTESQLATALFVRFQRVGPNGNDSDVGRGVTDIPEPAGLLLLGTGVAALVARRRKSVVR